MSASIPNRSQLLFCSGVTLIELLVILAIIAILSTFSLPSFANMVAKARVDSTAQIIQSELYSARKSAIRNAKDIVVSFQNTRTQWCIGIALDENPLNCNCLENSHCLSSHSFQNTQGVKLQQARFAGGDDYLGFDARRGSTLVKGKFRNGSIWLQSNRGNQVAIVISRLGRIRVCRAGEKQCPTPP